jgi:hypothetical protein
MTAADHESKSIDQDIAQAVKEHPYLEACIEVKVHPDVLRAAAHVIVDAVIDGIVAKPESQT